MFKLGIFGAGLLLLSGCSGDCTNTVIDRAASPDGQHTAVMFQRDCGATTGFSTQISVSPAREESSGGGNTYRADADHGAAAVGDWGGPWAEMRWIDKHNLLIRYAARSRIFEQVEQVSGVKVSYQQVQR